MNRLRPQDSYGEYRLIKKLGVGGMAEVWLAQPTTPWHREPYVVLKRVHAHLAEDERLRRMFLDEARLAGRLNHPNVLRVLDCGELEDELFMTMELVDGLDLRACLDLHEGPLLPSFAAALIADACIGLQYAHALTSSIGKPLNVVHRDIAPDNIMVDVQGRVQVVDFGIARADTHEVTTQTGLRKGKARYMAPEYMLAHDCTPKSDVYSMAATLFELVTGMRPYGDLTSAPAVINKIIKEGLPRADTVRPSLPAALVRIIADASAHDPKRRLPSAKALESRLRDFLSEFAPPARAEIGAEVSLWKTKRGDDLKVPRRVAGSFGQLETTEVVRSIHLIPDITQVSGGRGKAANVQVAHALDTTDFQMEAPSMDDSTDPSMEAPGAITDTHSVVLIPELEAVATRSRNKSKKAKKKR